MVQAPKCKLCGAAHWSTQDHEWAGTDKPTKGELLRKAASAVLASQRGEVATKVLERAKEVAAPPPQPTVSATAPTGSIRTRKKRKMTDVVEKGRVKVGASGGGSKRPPGQVAVAPSPKRPRKVAVVTGSTKASRVAQVVRAQREGRLTVVEPPSEKRRGRPVAEKPWDAEGISRAAWYKRGNRKGLEQ